MVSVKIASICALLILATVAPALGKLYILDDREVQEGPSRPIPLVDDAAVAGSEARVRRDGGGHGVTGPVHTYVKTDKHAHFKWGVRHHVGHHYAG